MKFKEENIMSNLRVENLNFELVEGYILGYRIWNIGTHMPEGYLPLCRLKDVQPFEGAAEVDTETLKAIKTEGAQLILDAVHAGTSSISSMEEYLEKHKNAAADTYERWHITRIERALPYMRKIKNIELCKV